MLVARYLGVCCPEGEESGGGGGGGGGADGLAGSEAAGQLPAIDPGLPGSGPGIFPSDASPTSEPDPVPSSTPPQVRGQCTALRNTYLY